MAFSGIAAQATGKAPAGEGLEGLRAEQASISAQLASIAQTLGDGESSVDQLEAALVRRGALELRAKALSSKIASEEARLADEERERRKQEAAALKQEAESLMRKAADALMALQPLGEQHMALVTRMRSLGGVSYTADNRGDTLRVTLNNLLPMLQPGRFYPIDQRGTLADREK